MRRVVSAQDQHCRGIAQITSKRCLARCSSRRWIGRSLGRKGFSPSEPTIIGQAASPCNFAALSVTNEVVERIRHHLYLVQTSVQPIPD